MTTTLQPQIIIKSMNRLEMQKSEMPLWSGLYMMATPLVVLLPWNFNNADDFPWRAADGAIISTLTSKQSCTTNDGTHVRHIVHLVQREHVICKQQPATTRHPDKTKSCNNCNACTDGCNLGDEGTVVNCPAMRSQHSFKLLRFTRL